MIVEHYLLPSRRKILPKTRLYRLFLCMYKFWIGEKKKQNTANAALKVYFVLLHIEH